MTQPASALPPERDVFISYSRQNKDFALQLVDALHERGRGVWIDLDAIPPSAEWWAEIKRGIDAAHTIVPILTPESLASPVCTFELDYAIRQHKRIIPLLRNEAVKAQTFAAIAAVEPTDFLAEILGNADLLDMARDNWRVIERLNWIMCRDEDDFDAALKTFLAALDTDLERARLHARLLSRAHEWQARGRDTGFLLVEGELREAASWLKVYGDQPPRATDEQRAFIQASLEKDAADEAARQRQIAELDAATQRAELQRHRARRAIMGAVLAAALALLAGGFGVFQTNSARQQQRIARTAVDNAAAAETLVGQANISLATATHALATATSVAQQASTGEAALQSVNTQVAQAVATVTQAAVVEDIVGSFAGLLLDEEISPAAQMNAMDGLVARYPDEALVYLHRGLMHDVYQQYTDAIANYDKAIRLNPDYARAYNLRGNAHLYLGDYEQAIADFGEVIRLDPEYAVAFYNRGNVYLEMQDLERALADFDESIRRAPSYPAAYNNRGLVYLQLLDYERALADFDESIRLDPEYANAYSNRGNAYHHMGQYDRALTDFNEAIRLDPQFRDAYNNRAFTYLRLAERETDTEQQREYYLNSVSNFRQFEALGGTLSPSIAEWLTDKEAELAEAE